MRIGLDAWEVAYHKAEEECRNPSDGALYNRIEVEELAENKDEVGSVKSATFARVMDGLVAVGAATSWTRHFGLLEKTLCRDQVTGLGAAAPDDCEVADTVGIPWLIAG